MTRTVAIPIEEIRLRTSRSSGPAAGAVIAWLVRTIVVRGGLPQAPSFS